MCYAVLGGTFDPVHVGHVALVKYVLSYIPHSIVIVSCAYQNPHKTLHAYGAHVRHRLAMVKLAFVGMERVIVDESEVHAACISYTVDMILRLRRLHDIDDTMYFIVGGDIVHDIPQWKDAKKLSELVSFLVYPRYQEYRYDRPRDDDGKLFYGSHVGYGGIESHGFTYIYMHEAPHIDISSTDIRVEYAQGRISESVLPASVQEYIRVHSLYS